MFGIFRKKPNIAEPQAPKEAVNFGIVKQNEFFDLMRAIGVFKRKRDEVVKLCRERFPRDNEAEFYFNVSIIAINHAESKDFAAANLDLLRGYKAVHLEINMKYAYGFFIALEMISDLLQSRPNSDTLNLAALCQRLIEGFRQDANRFGGVEKLGQEYIAFIESEYSRLDPASQK